MMSNRIYLACEHTMFRLRQLQIGLQRAFNADERPLGLVVIACWYWGLALASVVVAMHVAIRLWQVSAAASVVDLARLGTPIRPSVPALWYDPVPWVEQFGPTLFVVLTGATILVALGMGIWRYHPVAYWVVVGTNAWSVAERLMTERAWTTWMGTNTVIAAGIVWYLMRPRLRRFYWY